MSSYDVSSCSVLDEDCICLKGFNISFSWDYPDNWCLKDVQENVFHILDAKDKSKPDTDALINLVQSSGSGVVLTQPNPERDVIPCELNMKAHPDSIQFCITNILVISEARHIELYINDMYDKTSKGTVLSIRKGKKAAIYESQLDLSAHVQGTQKVTLKFLSLADKESMRLQAIVLTIIECANPNINPSKKSVSSADVNSVREMMKSMNVTVSNEADKLMKDIENQQKQNKLLFQNLSGINPQQLYQLSQIIPSQVTANPNILAQQVGTNQSILGQQIGSTQNIHPAQLAAFQGIVPPQAGLTPLNNLIIHPTISMPSVAPVPNQASQTCCLHAYQQQQNVQQQRPANLPNGYDKIFSKSCPGSRNGSPTETCGHPQNLCSIHAPTAHVTHRSSCATMNGYIENGFSHSTHTHSGNVNGNVNGSAPYGSTNGHAGNRCFGLPNPPNESILANAILNERPSKEISRNRISLIEQENYHEAQVQLRNSFHQSESSLLSRGSVKLRHADNVSRKCLSERKRRAKSLCSMPTESEMDFSQLLTEIIKDEAQNDKGTKQVDLIEDEDDSKISARWESYLRSRVRASRRNSDTNDYKDVHNGHQNGYYGDDSNNALVVSDLGLAANSPRCKECGGNFVQRALDEMSTNLSSMEQKLTSHIDVKIEELRHHLDKRLDTLLEIINVPQPYDYDETLCSNTEV